MPALIGFSAMADAPPLIRNRTNVRRDAPATSPEDGVTCPQRILVRQRMPSGEIAKAEELRWRRVGTIDDSRKPSTHDVGERLGHGVAGLTHGDNL